MARPRSISNDLILEAALAVFEEYGYSATTAQIAARAGISEGTLFKRYASKEELFLASVGFYQEPCWYEDLHAGGPEGVADLLERAALTFLARARILVPKLMALWSRGTAAPPPHEHRDPMEADRLAIQAYLEAEVRLHRLKPHDTRAMSRIVMGALMHHVILEVRQNGGASISDAEFARTLTASLFGGLRP